MKTPLEIARLEEKRQALGTAAVVDEAEEIAGGWMTYGGPGSWSNQAAGLGLQGPVSAAELDRLVEFFTSRRAEPKIEVCPFADQTLVDGLAERGFCVIEFENVLARELAPEEDFQALSSHAWPAGLAIQRVDPGNDQMVQDFIEVSKGGFAESGLTVDEDFHSVWRRTINHPGTDVFLALWNGQPAGNAALESTTGVGCLFSASVLPVWRRRGTQTALMIRRLERARDNGCELVTVHSDPGNATERNALRLGFRMVYSKAIMALPGEIPER